MLLRSTVVLTALAVATAGAQQKYTTQIMISPRSEGPIARSAEI
jgi:hypothetical protein